MASSDPERARNRFLFSLQRIEHGLNVQRDRCIASGTDNLISFDDGLEIKNFVGEKGNDVDYYVFELARLQDVAREMSKTFDSPREVVDALAVFALAFEFEEPSGEKWNRLRRIRNPITHIDDTSRLDDVLWTDSVMLLKPGGEVTYLVDPRYE